MSDEDDWPVMSGFVGQDVMFNQMLGWAEKATGREFELVYNGINGLERGEVTNITELMKRDNFMRDATVMSGVMAVRGLILLPDKEGFRLNERSPDLEVMTMERLVKEAWKREEGYG